MTRILTLLFILSTIHLAEAADWKAIPILKSGMVSATANQNFGRSPGKTEKTALPDFASFPQTLQAASTDQAGTDRSAKAEMRLEMEPGAIRFRGKLETTDAVPTDFLAPVASMQGAVVVDLKIMLPNETGTLKGSFRVSAEGPAAIIPPGEKNPLPDSIIAKVFVNDELVLNSVDFVSGVDKEIPPLHHGDIVTLLFQEDFSMFSSGQADLLSTFRYTFSQ
ncbi:MAG: hypothetical protein HY282_11765 [Nitrospirae bacterium]|nr:hypothetical protein [Candidatus Manganitrophaceae bacterium]